MPSDPWTSGHAPAGHGLSSTGSGTYARWSDGRTAVAHDATANLTADGIAIALASSSTHFIWPYHTLSAGEPLRQHSVDAVIRSKSAPGCSLFVPDPKFVASLAKLTPRLTARAERAERWHNARPWVAGMLAVVVLITAANVFDFSPAHALAQMVPQSWSRRLGDETMRSMTEGKKSCVEPAGMAAVETLMRRLSTGGLSTGFGHAEPFEVIVSDWTVVNAFAVPGGKIILLKGLIDKAQSPDELAGVLAHEMGHGISLHAETGIIRAVGFAAALEFMMGGSSGTLANLGLVLAQLSYSRVAEHEADLQAIALLKKAQISPHGFADFFKRMEDTERDGDKGKGWTNLDLLRSHPPTAERAALIESQPAYEATPALSPELWQNLKQVCSATIEAAK